jgi:hypothetical protein
MKKFFITAGALVALAVPSAALAAAPQSYSWKAPNQGDAGVNASIVGVDSSQVIQNGPAVSAQAQAGDRAATVQAIHAAEGIGSLVS